MNRAHGETCIRRRGRPEPRDRDGVEPVGEAVRLEDGDVDDGDADLWSSSFASLTNFCLKLTVINVVFDIPSCRYKITPRVRA